MVRIPRNWLQVFEFVNKQMLGGGGKILHRFLRRDHQKKKKKSYIPSSKLCIFS